MYHIVEDTIPDQKLQIKCLKNGYLVCRMGDGETITKRDRVFAALLCHWLNLCVRLGVKGV